jgi:hypothetical protein
MTRPITAGRSTLRCDLRPGDQSTLPPVLVRSLHSRQPFTQPWNRLPSPACGGGAGGGGTASATTIYPLRGTSPAARIEPPPAPFLPIARLGRLPAGAHAGPTHLHTTRRGRARWRTGTSTSSARTRPRAAPR